jgi:YD repeat-containing protein
MKRESRFLNGVKQWDVEWDAAAHLIRWSFADGRVDGWRSMDESELAEFGLKPLDAAGVMATLNAVLGIWPVEDAANAVGLTPDDLVAEAQAWAVAGS